MKLAEKLLGKFYEGLPKNAEIGKIYNKILVDGETFNKMKLVDINPFKAEMIFKSPKSKHYFNYVEQEIVLK